MPPKYKRSCPIVVGTVSTRSTRRESVVNVDILPKTIKPGRKCNKKSLKQTVTKMSQVKRVEKFSKNKEILEILKDWSDDDSNQEVNSPNESSNVVEIFDEIDTSNTSSSDDKQSLIDILEGNKTTVKNNPEVVEQLNIQNLKQESSVENPIVEVESSNDSLIIEECVVEDDSVIIEMPVDQLIIEERGTHFEKADIEIVDMQDKDTSNNVTQIVESIVESKKPEESTKEKAVLDESDTVTCEHNTEINDDNNKNQPLQEDQVITDNMENQSSEDPIIIEGPSIEDEYMEVVEETVIDYSEDLSVQSEPYITEEAIDETKSASSDDTSQSMETVIDESSTENISIPILKSEQEIDKESAKSKPDNIQGDDDCTRSECQQEPITESVIMETNNSEKDTDEVAELKAEIEAHLNINETPSETHNQQPTEESKMECSITDLEYQTSKILDSEPEKSQSIITEDDQHVDSSKTDICVTENVNDTNNVDVAEPIVTNTENEIDQKCISDDTPQVFDMKDDLLKLSLEELPVKSNTDVEMDLSEEVKPEISKNKKSAKYSKKLNESDTEVGTKSQSRRSARKKDQKSDLSLTKTSESQPVGASTEVPKLVENETPSDKLKQKASKTVKKVKEPKSKSAKHVEAKKGKNKVIETGENFDEVRRSNRIKSISSLKKRSTYGLVKSKSESALNEGDISDSSSLNELDKTTPTASPKTSAKERSKSASKSKDSSSQHVLSQQVKNESKTHQIEQVEVKPRVIASKGDEIKERLKSFIHLKENLYKTDRQVCKEAKEMMCDCYLAEEDIQNDEYGCGDDCLNRLLMIECGDLCQVGQRCTNKRFQRGQFAPVEVFKTEKKGLGLRAAANIPYGEFILEYVGEVLDPDEFDKRAEVYSEDKNIHHYFMSLRADAIIDATMKGNISRFINHSCEPNAETQKWTVNGELRIGFFSTRTILAGEEVTFDYRFQRYGREAQKCFCEASTCRGWLGERPDESEEEDEEDEVEKDVSTDNEKAVNKEFKQENKSLLSKGEKEGVERDSKFEAQQSKKDVDTVVEKNQLTPKPVRRKPRKEILEDLDLNEEIEMLITTGLKNQAHTLKLSRLMVRAKEPEQRKKLLHVLRRGELPCRRLFLDYHGLRLMHGYMIDAEQLANVDKKFASAKLELLQTLAVLPVQNKTMLIESKVLPAVEKLSKTKREEKFEDKEVNDKEEEIRFLAKKLLEEWANLKESFRIPKKERIEQMKEHEKEANRKFMASSYSQEQESSRKNDHRYRTWSRYKNERESSSKKVIRPEDKDKPSAAFLKISKHERRKLFALQMELKEEERRLKQREMWRQHEMNCMIIGTDPRFTAPFDPNKGFQYIWNPSIGQWQALPVQTAQNQSMFSAASSQVPIPSMNVPPPHRPPLLTTYPSPLLNNISGLASTPTQLSGLNITGLPVPLSNDAVQASAIPTAAQVYTEIKKEDESGPVKFAGPIPPPVKLPPKWKCAKDKYGRPYYYHIKIRKSQWEPPPLIPEPIVESSPSTSSETSSLSSDSSSDSDEDEEIDDTKLLMEVRKQMDKVPKSSSKSSVSLIKQEEQEYTPSPDIKEESDDELQELIMENIEKEKLSSIDIRLKEQFNWDSEKPPQKKRRVGLCQEIIISPRTEEDHLQFKEDMKRYKANKEKLKRQKEIIFGETKKKLKLNLNEEGPSKKLTKKLRSSVKSRMKEISSCSNDAKKIKENFRSNMATTVVSVLNAYRKPDCREGRITNTEDFKHLARKLTHFVMLKEMKHIDKIDELTCTDNVKAKAREYIKKYMSKFGETYQKRQDEPDFKD